ncbi:EamA family transporter [Paenibacillus sp. UNC499MF]|uniref:EamA family transporter n=1 Tax=Paenibacillus sp. UNC499MF TaxID=1502751 RepID=UPI00089FDB88|nr:EamA family transporter [Paenibacillus sp. UNC499MF]SEG72033.1 Permease of the drug/metabolite transporter (DMT) superfamily [Paenibacillus sp. UNC499MF]
MKQPAATKLPQAGVPPFMAITAALLLVYLFWGGTYLGMKIAIETIPPFTMGGIRFLSAGFILYILARFKGVKRPNAGEWKGAGIAGALLLLGGNGVVAWAEQRVPSAVASLLVATVPLWMLVFGWAGPSRKKPSAGVMTGIVLGFAGIVILVHPGSSSGGSLDMAGIAALLLASVSWSIGSLYSRKAKLPESPLLSTAVQMVVGGSLLLIVSLVLGEWSGFQPGAVTLRSFAALGYLIAFGSIVSYTAYIWLLKHAEPVLVSTYAFVNPVVAVFLGWFLGGEQLSSNSLTAACFIVAAVAVITVSGKSTSGRKSARRSASVAGRD